MRPAAARCAAHPDAPALGVCTRCGTFACADCRATELGGLRCVTCGPADASLERRAAAWVVDTAAWVVAVLVAWQSSHTRGSDWAQNAEGARTVVWATGSVTLLQLALQLGVGQSLGKWLLGVRVARLDGRPAEWWRVIFVRNLAFTVLLSAPSILPLVGLLQPVIWLGAQALVLTPERRALHDYLASTRVVTVR